MFGNIRQGDREFNCSDFSNHVDKQNRRFELAFKSDLQMSKEDNSKGYQETFSDFISGCKLIAVPDLSSTWHGPEQRSLSLHPEIKSENVS